MINTATILKDDLADDVGALLAKLNSRTKWDREKHLLSEELIKLLDSKK